jgi:hypothetical protein
MGLCENFDGEWKVCFTVTVGLVHGALISIKDLKLFNESYNPTRSLFNSGKFYTPNKQLSIYSAPKISNIHSICQKNKTNHTRLLWWNTYQLRMHDAIYPCFSQTLFQQMWRNFRLAAATELIIWMISQQLPSMLHWYSTVVSLMCIISLTFLHCPVSIYCAFLRFLSTTFNRPLCMPHKSKLCCYVLMVLQLCVAENVKLLWSSGAKDEDKVVKTCNAVTWKTGDLSTLRNFWLSTDYYKTRIFISLFHAITEHSSSN